MKYHKWMKKAGMLALVGCLTIPCIFVPVYAEESNTEVETEKNVFPEDAIYLSTSEDVLTLAENCIDDVWSLGKTIVLNNDIDMSGVEFKGIPTFGGTFYGQGYCISGIRIEHEQTAMGFFRYVQKKAVIDNLQIDAVIRPTGSADAIGALAGVNRGTIKNCSFSGTVSGKEKIGGIVGWNKITGIIENCRTEGVVFGEHYIGGIVGENQGVVRQCTNLAEVNTKVEHNSLSLDMTGGVSLENGSISMKESLDNATNIGGIAGTSSGVIRECINRANVGYPKMGYNVGGIAGSQIGYMADCVNYAQINGSDGVGGVVGHFKPNVVLEFGENPMDTMSKDMKRMTASMRDVIDAMEEMDMSSSGIDMSSMTDALDIFENGMSMDLDSLYAAMNDISNLYNDVNNEMTEMTQSMEGMTTSMGNMMNSMTQMMISMETMMNNMTSMNLSMEYEIIDISRDDKENNTIAKAYHCENYGIVNGENYVGGIAGLAAVENTSVQEDADTKGEMSTNGEVVMRLVIRDCRNAAKIAATKECAGGIVGSMEIGAIFNSVNSGNIDSMNADYVGGIAGKSDTIILDSSSKCIIAGANYVGGIAGFGTEVFDSYAFSDIAAYQKLAGGILGNTEILPDDNKELVQNNKYYLVGKNLGGIDGISYDGATNRISLEEYLALENLDEAFKTVTIRFEIAGQEDVVVAIPTGESMKLSEVPILDVEDNQIYEWQYEKPVVSKVLAMNKEEDISYLSESKLTNVLFNQTYEAIFDAKDMVTQGENRTEDNHSVILAVGAFDKETSVELKDKLQEENLVNEHVVIENWEVMISNIGVEKLHYRIPEGKAAEDLILYVKDATGTWSEREFMVEGSYIIFAFTDGEIGFALEEKTGSILAENAAAVIAIAAGAVCILVFAIKKKNRAKNKK